MEDLELQPEQCQALMKSPCPVADVLRDFEKLELGYMETLRDCIEGRADKLKYGALLNRTMTSSVGSPLTKRASTIPSCRRRITRITT